MWCVCERWTRLCICVNRVRLCCSLKANENHLPRENSIAGQWLVSTCLQIMWKVGFHHLQRWGGTWYSNRVRKRPVKQQLQEHQQETMWVGQPSLVFPKLSTCRWFGRGAPNWTEPRRLHLPPRGIFNECLLLRLSVPKGVCFNPERLPAQQHTAQ